MMIHNIEELAAALETTVSRLEHDIYKYNDSVSLDSYDDHGITLIGYVENGGTYSGQTDTLEFPFTMDDYDHSVKVLEGCAEHDWHCLNDEAAELGIPEDDDEEDARWEMLWNWYESEEYDNLVHGITKGGESE